MTKLSRISSSLSIAAVTLGAGLLCTQAHAGSVSGKVVDKNGKPVEGLVVKAWDMDSGGKKLMATGTTNSQGKFTVGYSDTYKEGGDIFGGGTQPDLHVTVEAKGHYGSGNYAPAGQSTGKPFGVVGGSGVGAFTKIYDWPAVKKWLPDVDPRSDLQTGTLKINAVDAWDMRRTKFDPAVHGLGYNNNTKRKICWGPTCKSPWNELFGTQQNLCGGFAVTALKRFVDGKCDTFSQYGPADATLKPAHKEEIVKNQLATFFFWTYLPNHDPGWAVIDNLVKNPLGALPTSFPGFRFFEWQAKTNVPNQQFGNTIGASSKIEWSKIQAEISARKMPVVIGLINAQAPNFNLADIDLVTENHQVLVIGYDANPFYQGVTLYVYDPNYPGEVKQLRFSTKLDKSEMYIKYNGDSRTRGFFVNTTAPKGVVAPATTCPVAAPGGGA